MGSLSVAFWGCFLGHNITSVFGKVLLLWGTSWGGRQISWGWGSWMLGLVWREIRQRPGGRISGLGAVTGQSACPLSPGPAMGGRCSALGVQQS